MFYVYALQSIRDPRWLYIGYSSDLSSRFLKHNQGEVKSTKDKRPLALVYYEAYVSNLVAAKREYELKHNSQQKEIIKLRIGNHSVG